MNLKSLALAGSAMLMWVSAAYGAEGTIKIGVLHSLSGTMAISETTLKDAMLMLIDEQNKKGGILGKKLEAVVVDPASDWPLVRRENARADLGAQSGRDLRLLDLACRANPCFPSWKS